MHWRSTEVHTYLLNPAIDFLEPPRRCWPLYISWTLKLAGASTHTRWLQTNIESTDLWMGECIRLRRAVAELGSVALCWNDRVRRPSHSRQEGQRTSTG